MMPGVRKMLPGVTKMIPGVTIPGDDQRQLTKEWCFPFSGLPFCHAGLEPASRRACAVLDGPRVKPGVTNMMPGVTNMMPGVRKMLPGVTKMIPGVTIPGDDQRQLTKEWCFPFSGLPFCHAGLEPASRRACAVHDGPRIRPGVTNMMPGVTNMMPGVRKIKYADR